LAVLADPHLGTFGAVTIVLALLVKTAAVVALAHAMAHFALTQGWTSPHELSAVHGFLAPPLIAAIPLVASWARLGPLGWSRWLGAAGGRLSRPVRANASPGASSRAGSSPGPSCFLPRVSSWRPCCVPPPSHWPVGAFGSNCAWEALPATAWAPASKWSRS